jgi:hypothetical protein
MTTQAAHAASWHFTGNLYANKSACVDDGQQYQREGYRTNASMVTFRQPINTFTGFTSTINVWAVAHGRSSDPPPPPELMR